MSNFLSIAAVTAALRRGLLANVQADLAGADVTTARPDRPGAVGVPARGVNVYLYKAAPSGARRSDNMPSRDAAGHLRRRPRVAVDLDYLFSFYGNEAALEPQRLLGSTLRYLHSRPELTRDLIEAAMSDAATSFLARADLADEEERVRFTPITLTLEDMSRIWSVFFQVPYVLSTAYRASVVVIEPDASPAPALPVRTFGLRILPLVRAVIEQALPEEASAVGPSADGTLLLRGAGLTSLPLLIAIDGATLRIPEEDVVGAGVRLRLLRVPLRNLRAGVRSVKAIREIDFGEPPVPHRALESNVAAFLLQPLAGTARAAAGELLVQVSPPAGERQPVRLLLDALDGSRSLALDSLSRGTESELVSAAAAGGDTAFSDLRLDSAASREVLLSDPRPAFAGPTRDPAQVEMAAEDGSLRSLAIAGRPPTMGASAVALEGAIRAAGATPAFTNARVLSNDGRLLIVPGAPGTAFRFGRTGDDPAAEEFGLRAAAPAGALLSGDLTGFHGLHPGANDILFSIGDRANILVSIAAAPATLNDAAAALEAALRSANPDDLFRQARVHVIDGRLLIVHGRNELRFPMSAVPAGSYLARIEVDGAANSLTTNVAGQYNGPLVEVP